MRMFLGLGLLLMGCGGAGFSGSTEALSDAGGAAGSAGVAVLQAGATVTLEAGSGGAGSAAGSPAIGSHAGAGAGTGGEAGRAGAAGSTAGSGSGGSLATGGASGSAGAGGSVCVPRKACANAGIIVDGCLPCDQQHCGNYPDGCNGTVECGTCAALDTFCTDAHACTSYETFTPGCTATRTTLTAQCLAYENPLGGTDNVYCPVAPPADSGCTWAPPMSSDGGYYGCWICTGAT